MAAVVLFKNLAQSLKVRNQIKEEWLPIQKQARDDRMGRLHPQWLRHLNIWYARHDSRAYHGRLAAYLPIGRRVIENWVQKLKADLFPRSNRWVAATVDSEDDSSIPVLEAGMHRWVMESMRLRRHAGPWLRTLVTLGTAPAEIGWQHVERFVPYVRYEVDERGKPSPRATEDIKRILEKVGPTWRQPDLFTWYVWPYTIRDLEESQVIFEDMLVEQSDIRRLGAAWIDPDREELGHQYEQTAAVFRALREATEAANGKKTGDSGEGSSGNADDKFAAERSRLSARGLTARGDMDKDPRRPIDIAKGWWFGTIEEDVVEELGEEEAEPRWYQVTTAMDTHVMQVRRNIWWFTRPNQVAAKFVEVDNEFYGYGLPCIFDSLQYFLNDTINQAGDGLTWSMNPIAAVDPFAVQDPSSIRMRPAARWLVRNPGQSVKFMEPPKDSAQIGFMAIQQLIALMNDVVNVAPFGGAGLSSGGRSRGRALQTAGGMQIVLSEALIAVQDVVENVEDHAYNPMLGMNQRMGEQCLDTPLRIRLQGIAGAQYAATELTRGQLAQDVRWKWLASTSNYNSQVRGSQMLQFAQIALRVPPELWQQHGISLELGYLMKQIWSVGMELPDPDKIIKDLNPTTTVDAKLENTLYVQGRGEEVRVSPADDDLQHARTHDALLQDPEVPEPLRQLVIQHIRSHMASFLAKKLMTQMQGQGQLTAMGGGAGILPGADPGAGAGGGADGGPVMTSGRTVMPDAPGRPKRTTSLDDVMRQNMRGLT